MKQLRLTTSNPMSVLSMMGRTPLITPDNIGELVMDKVKGSKAYIHGKAESIAGFDLPIFIDGDLGQLDLPTEQQDILLLLPMGEYKCKAEYHDEIGASNCYLITLASEPSVFS